MLALVLSFGVLRRLALSLGLVDTRIKSTPILILGGNYDPNNSTFLIKHRLNEESLHWQYFFPTTACPEDHL